MSWQDDVMIEQERADALEYMGEAEWRDTFEKAMSMAAKDQKEMLKKAKRSDYNKRYWAEHKEQISAKRKKHYVENREEITARNVQWKKDNKDHWNAYLREWRKKKKLDKKEQV